jgi:hypothetical protein
MGSRCDRKIKPVNLRQNQTAADKLVQLQDIIAAGLVAGAENPSVGEKYKWLARKLNRFIAKRELSSQIAAIEIE